MFLHPGVACQAVSDTLPSCVHLGGHFAAAESRDDLDAVHKTGVKAIPEDVSDENVRVEMVERTVRDLSYACLQVCRCFPRC
jgi:hypothetical protein